MKHLIKLALVSLATVAAYFVIPAPVFVNDATVRIVKSPVPKVMADEWVIVR